MQNLACLWNTRRAPQTEALVCGAGGSGHVRMSRSEGLISLLPDEMLSRCLCSAARSCSQHRPSGLAPGRRQLRGGCMGWRFLHQAAPGCPLPAGLARPLVCSASQGKVALPCSVIPESLLAVEDSCSSPLGHLCDVCVLRVR